VIKRLIGSVVYVKTKTNSWERGPKAMYSKEAIKQYDSPYDLFCYNLQNLVRLASIEVLEEALNETKELINSLKGHKHD